MPSASKELKGYIKTENMILIAVITLAVGFLGGVAFGIYKSGNATLPAGASASASAPLSADQARQIETLVARTRSAPNDSEAWTELGHLYFDTEQPAKAIEAYEKSLSLSPERPDVWTDLGVMYRRNSQPQKAVECFDRALSIKSDHEIALFNKGVVLMHDLQDAKGALAAWQKLVQINPQARTPSGQSVKALVDELQKQN